MRVRRAPAGSALDGEALREFLGDRVAKWWLPDRVEFILEVPKTSVGKFDKKVLRAQLADDSLERASVADLQLSGCTSARVMCNYWLHIVHPVVGGCRE